MFIECGFRVQGVGCKVKCLGFGGGRGRLWGLGLRVWECSLGFGVSKVSV